jgi:hypothetical protein
VDVFTDLTDEILNILITISNVKDSRQTSSTTMPSSSPSASVGVVVVVLLASLGACAEDNDFLTVRVGRRSTPSTVADVEWLWGPAVCRLVQNNTLSSPQLPQGVLPAVRLSEVTGCNWAFRASSIGSSQWQAHPAHAHPTTDDCCFACPTAKGVTLIDASLIVCWPHQGGACSGLAWLRLNPVMRGAIAAPFFYMEIVIGYAECLASHHTRTSTQAHRCSKQGERST